MTVRSLVGVCVLVCLSLGLVGCGGSSGTVKKANAGAKLGETGFVIKTLEGGAVKDRKFGVFVPYGYDGSKAYPVILFLHGAFEGGGNPEVAFSVGLGAEIAARAKTFDYIAIFPQTRGGNWGAESTDLADAYRALQQVKRQYKVDNDRVILTGLSIGGYGVWALAEEHPDEFAALVPMCGYSKPDAVPAIKHIPTWAFHNNMDPFVMVGASTGMIDRMKKAGAKDARITTYVAMGHDVWVRAYREETLWAWLAQQRRTRGAGAV